jgi:hypothetical protein
MELQQTSFLQGFPQDPRLVPGAPGVQVVGIVDADEKLHEKVLLNANIGHKDSDLQ